MESLFEERRDLEGPILTHGLSRSIFFVARGHLGTGRILQLVKDAIFTTTFISLR
jgi:hypothetical protein